jgi:hypothetical protein
LINSGKIKGRYCKIITNILQNAGLLQKFIVKKMLLIPNCGKIIAGILFKTEVKIKATYIKIRKFQGNLSQNCWKNKASYTKLRGKSRQLIALQIWRLQGNY